MRDPDPYDLDLPSGWTVRRDEDRVTYRGPEGDPRVSVAAAVQGIRLYFRVERRGAPGADGSGLGRLFTDESAAARRAQELVRAAARDAEAATAGG